MLLFLFPQTREQGVRAPPDVEVWSGRAAGRSRRSCPAHAQQAGPQA